MHWVQYMARIGGTPFMVQVRKPVALITGASSGLAKDFALRLLKDGYAVYGAAR
jgi:NADP-dependent 3-hydroxy acid dehydrogenase YdfG